MLREGKEGLGDFEKRVLGVIENLQDILNIWTLGVFTDNH